MARLANSAGRSVLKLHEGELFLAQKRRPQFENQRADIDATMYHSSRIPIRFELITFSMLNKHYYLASAGD